MLTAEYISSLPSFRSMDPRHASLVKTAFFAAMLGVLGILAAFVGSVRLGRGRGRGDDYEYLHLDWITQPDLPYWGAHMANLETLAVGLLCMGAALVLLLRGGLRWWTERPESSNS